MGFNYTTLLFLPVGLILPAAVILFFVLSKLKKQIAYDTIAYGFGSFFISAIAVFVAFIALNTVFLSGITFSDETSGLAIAGTVFGVMLVLLFFVCESLKLISIKKFIADETKNKFSSLGFSAGIVLAQNALVFVALNVIEQQQVTPGFAIFSGTAILFTGIIYTLNSICAEIALKLGSRATAYALSAVYYLFWLSVIVFVSSSVLIWVSTALFLAVSVALFIVFMKKA